MRRASGKDGNMIYITGDTHGQFERIETFCKRFETTKGDVGIMSRGRSPLKDIRRSVLR